MHIRLARPMLAVVAIVGAIATAYAITRRGTAPEPVIAPQGAAVPRPPGTTLEITYIANEGVLIADGGKQVLIDGLHREYEPDYAFLPQPYRERIETAQPPFDKIDVILVSHRHLDHFHPQALADHLRHNATTVLVSSEQVVHEIESKTADFGTIRARVTTTTPALRQKIATTAGGVELEILGLGHGTGRHRDIQNLGHVVKLGGKKLLHVGDADTSPEIFEAFHLDEQNIDVAFLPTWFLLSDEGADIVRNHIKPKHIVAVHLGPREPARTFERIRARFPDAAAFAALLEKRYY
jgi:L-ascorbate metabolism protein UlaG (beta-lactamase superfamily)